jgi:hypothetical protein
MVTTRALLVTAAFAALGLTGWMAPQRGEAGDSGAAPGEPPAAKQPQYVLLTDGRMVRGVLSEEDNMVVVTQPIGAMRYPKKRVEQVFPSLRKVYEYKLEQLPENDADERIKLARWCLAQNLEPEARQQLAAVLDRSPKHFQAKAMLASLDQARERRLLRVQDSEVKQAGGVQEGAPGDDRPGALDAAVISGARRGLGVSEMPIVFDLPPAQAVRRADEFARYVHPVVQLYCARCHNEQYDGTFQLIPFKARADKTRDALKANMDACLRLIDRDNPPRSELLASALRPHGRGPNKRPIFRGSNDRAYQILSSWVNKLQATRGPDSSARPLRPALGGDPEDRFASSRERFQGKPGSASPEAVRFSTGPVVTKALPPARFEPGKGLVPDTSSDPEEFPLPLAAGGKKPVSKAASAAALQGGAPKPGSKPAASPGPGSSDAAVRPATVQTGSGPTAAEATPADPDDLSETTAPAGSTSPAKKARKPLKLDPSLLQRALQLKNQGR